MKTMGIGENADCFICRACNDDPSSPPLDRPLRRVSGVGAVLTGAGPLGEGYVLIVPHAHCGDIATAISLEPKFLDFIEERLAEYERLFGPYTLWEHGSAMLDVRTSGCVEHAHLNVITKTPLAAPADARPVRDWTQFAGGAGAPYLLLGSSGEQLQVGTDSGVAQHYRRQWAKAVGEADRWDYALTGGLELQQATAAKYERGEG